MAERPTAEIRVPSEDPKKKKEEEEKKTTEKKTGTSKANGDKKEEEELVRQTSVINVPTTDNVHRSQKRMLSSNLSLRC